MYRSRQNCQSRTNQSPRSRKSTSRYMGKAVGPIGLNDYLKEILITRNYVYYLVSRVYAHDIRPFLRPSTLIAGAPLRKLQT